MLKRRTLPEPSATNKALLSPHASPQPSNCGTGFQSYTECSTDLEVCITVGTDFCEVDSGRLFYNFKHHRQIPRTPNKGEVFFPQLRPECEMDATHEVP